MHKRCHFVITAALLLSSCTKFEEAELTERKSFVHFYSSAADYTATVAELDSDGGYILSGQVRNSGGSQDALIIKTDARGRKVWETILSNGVVNGILPLDNGYILGGDSIHINNQSADVHELINTFGRLVTVDSRGNITGSHISSGSIVRNINNEQVSLNIDYHVNAVTRNQQEEIIILGSFRVPDETESAFVAAYDPTNLRDSLWHKSYQSLEHHYMNCNSVFVTENSSIVWASKMYTLGQSLGREFLSVPRVAPNSALINHSLFGDDDDRNHSVKDMQRGAVGYCAIGTYSETTGLNPNAYFVRIDANLNVIPGSARYIDGQELIMNDRILEPESKDMSVSVDEGLAVAATDDGYLLATAMTTTPTVGNGGKDILLVKLDPFGNLLWKKLLGGTGDEVIASVRQTPDKGFLLFGTNTINGLSSMMLIKTDENGDIKD